MTTVTHGREKAVRFGSSASLIGVFTEAAAGLPNDDRPAFIFLNSGILHRVGSCRFHVRVARALSAAGFHSLRFDFSGIGDSEQRRDALSFEESAVLETREAMDYVTKLKGATRFVLMGLCSGADMAHETAIVDPRVVGMMQLDAWAYKNMGYHLRRYGPKLFELSAWKNSVAVRLKELRAKGGGGAESATPEGVEYEVPKYVRVFPRRDKLEREFRLLSDRGVRMFSMWSGGLEEYNHQGQHRETFAGVNFGNLLREEYCPVSDHIMSGLQHQQYLARSVVEWAQEFPSAAVESRVLSGASSSV
jgi:hypothetical protein